MTDFEMNLAIAEHFGWKRHPMIQWIVTDPKYPHSVQPLNTIPKYCEDLNAIHEAENTLTIIEQDEYWNFLWDVTGSEFELCHANAIQRAEAFLKTVGKWVNVCVEPVQ
jgi:hypothetical protein